MDQIREIEAARLVRLEQNPEQASHAMVRLLAQVIGIGIETADMLVHEVFVRNPGLRRGRLCPTEKRLPATGA